MWKQLVNPKFLFSLNTVLVEQVDRDFLVAGLLLLALAAVFKISAIYAPTPVDRHFRQRLFRLFSYIGFAELFWFGCRYEDIRFFGSHFVALLYLLIGLIWLGFVAVDIFRHYGQQRQAFEKEQVKLKYLQK